ncbi:MAG: N-acyl-D-amino-acid deacylase, partial [Candidatus Azotimanducaceae bacterium]
MFDLIIRNASVLDGTGAPAIEADVGISGDRIREVGSITGNAKHEVDAEGKTLAPGLVDTHSHDDGAFFRHPGMGFKLAQGVTTVVAGNCGFSAIPADPNSDT